MNCGYFKSQIGIIKITYEEKIKKIELVDKIKGESCENELFKIFRDQILEYLSGSRKDFDQLDLLDLEGTDFQKSVRKALLKIPYGKTSSYKKIAYEIGNPKAVRAVGTAVGKNPFLIIIPCHRIIKSDGSLGGFAYGSEIKRKLLKIEDNIF